MAALCSCAGCALCNMEGGHLPHRLCSGAPEVVPCVVCTVQSVAWLGKAVESETCCSKESQMHFSENTPSSALLSVERMPLHTPPTPSGAPIVLSLAQVTGQKQSKMSP